MEDIPRGRLALPQLPLSLNLPTSSLIPRTSLLQNLGLLNDPALTSAITASIIQQNAVQQLQIPPFYGFPGRSKRN